MNKKILIVINSSEYAYKMRLNLAKSIKIKGYRVIFVAPYDKKYTKLIKEEFEFINLEIDSKGINPMKDLKTIFQLYNIFKEIKPNILLNFTIKPNIYSALIGGVLGIKSINNITGLGTIFIKKSFITNIAKILYKFAFKSNHKVFFQNNEDLNLFLKNKLIKINKTELIPGSGVDLNKFIPQDRTDNKKFVFLMIARILKDKGVYEYIEAIKIIKEKYSDVEFQLLGASDSKNNTAISKIEIDNWIKEGLINYLGITDDVPFYISSSNCVVLPSYREGVSRSLLEAAAMEKPLITTDVPGCKEVVDDNKNGFLCKVKDSKDLANKMEIMLNLSENARINMGKEGRNKIIREFDEKFVINKYIKNIQEVLSE